MDKINRLILNVIFCLQVLLIFLLFVEDRIHLPAWLQVVGRMHPLILHLPIGIISFLVVLILFQKKIDKTVLRPVIHLALLLTSLSATAAALFGFFLSLQGDYGSDALMRHKVSGVLLSCFCYVALLWYQAEKKMPVFFALGIAASITLVFAGHTGSVLTHGENFLFGPGSGSEVILTAENASLYKFAVEPILEKKCFSCHNETKAKGKLVMTAVEKFRAGGENGKPWVEGKPSESRMIKSFYLPLNDDAHMPPDGKPQLTQIEIATLKAWIRSGADFEKKLNEFVEGDSLKLMVASIAAAQPAHAEEEIFSFEAASDDVVRKLNTPFRTIFPLYQSSPALQADFFVRKAFERKSLEELKAIEDQLVVLNLSRMPVTDKELSVIKSFRNLHQLNLNFSSIKGEGLKDLASLKDLRSLSLSGTAVGVHDLGDVLSLPNLKELFVWSTAVSELQRDSLAKKYPDVTIITSEFNDESVLKLSRPMLVNEGIIRKGDDVMLRHPMPGVTIRYTLDGSDPDTVKGLLYDTPLHFKETKSIKAIACKDKWFCSDVVEVTCFVEDIKPIHAELLNTPDKDYPGEGAKSLTDGRKGLIDVTKEPSWLGYRSQPFAAVFEFDSKASTLKQLTISYGRNLGAFIFPPQEVEVWGGEQKDQLKLIKKMKIDQPKDYQSLKIEPLTIPLGSSQHKYYKLIATPVSSLPSWHKNKGEKGWVFIDEVFFYSDAN